MALAGTKNIGATPARATPWMDKGTHTINWDSTPRNKDINMQWNIWCKCERLLLLPRKENNAIHTHTYTIKKKVGLSLCLSEKSKQCVKQSLKSVLWYVCDQADVWNLFFHQNYVWPIGLSSWKEKKMGPIAFSILSRMSITPSPYYTDPYHGTHSS